MNTLSYAIISSFFISITIATIGSFVVIKKISSITGSIAHSILGGVGIAIFLNYKNITNLDPIYLAFIFSILAAFAIGFMHLKYKQKEDATIASIWAVGMGIGVIFISLTPYSEDFVHFLFGDIFSIKKTDIYLLLIFNIIFLLSTLLFYFHFLIICFDEELAKLQNIKINLFYFFLLSLISLTTVLLIKIIGIILVIALITIPPTIAKIFTKKLPFVMLLSFLLSLIFIISGSLLSYRFHLPSGGIISLIAASFYLLTLIFKKKRLTY
jgi:zinc transport system permease protein